jgi:hypothetical protein
MRSKMALDFEIDEGGEFPESVFYRCGCVPEANPPKVPEGGCRCGFRCPKCGVVPRARRESVMELDDWEVARRICPECGAVICQYGVRLLARIFPASEVSN